LGIELVVLVVGWLLGGVVGLGTVMFAVLIGPAVGYGLALADSIGGVGESLPSDDAPGFDA